MPRYDKYSPIAGGFRAILAADLVFDGTGAMGPIVVSLDANGKVVIGTAGQSGGVGVLVKNVPMTPNLGSIAGQVNLAVPIGGRAGDVVDIMTSGEVVYDTAVLVAGTAYYCLAAQAATGALTATAPASGVTYHKVGYTAEATRLVVRFDRIIG
jgi:hypothetical protein